MSIKSFFQNLFRPLTLKEKIIKSLSHHAYYKNLKLISHDEYKLFLDKKQAEHFITKVQEYCGYSSDVSHYTNTSLTVIKEVYKFAKGEELKIVFLEDNILPINMYLQQKSPMMIGYVNNANEDPYLTILARSTKNLLDEDYPGNGLFMIGPRYYEEEMSVEVMEFANDDIDYIPLISELKIILDEG